MKLHTFLFVAVACLGACSTPAKLYPVTAPTAGDKIRTTLRSVEVREVSLPSYAAAEEIHIQGLDGALSSSADVLWADIPVRAISLELSRNLAELTGARIAAEPWPFDQSAQARLEVRIEELLASADGTFRASGQYFVTSYEGQRDKSGFFRLSEPFDPEAGPAAIAAARGRIIMQLARIVAKDGL
ncbi:MAG: putative lipoprotein YmbA [Ascidiaceihabitans sp.]|jgi:uncharacterized lipoprotein YmbA